MKKYFKLVGIVFVLFAVMVMLTGNLSEAFNYSDELKAGWTQTGDANVLAPTQNIVGSIIQVIRAVGTGVAIIMLTYVAIKYMSAAPSEKAEFKKSATAFIVGAIVLFATTNILVVIENFATKNISV